MAQDEQTVKPRGNAKLTERNVILIKRLLRMGRLSHETIAEIFHVHKLTIKDIADVRTWKHLTADSPMTIKPRRYP